MSKKYIRPVSEVEMTNNIKAIVKNTGEIVNVNYIPTLNQYSIEDGRIFLLQELILFISPAEKRIDLETKRLELAKAAMQGILSNQFSWGMSTNDIDDIATEAVRCADAVIVKLKEEQPKK